jgi:hypothetical protein
LVENTDNAEELLLGVEEATGCLFNVVSISVLHSSR